MKQLILTVTIIINFGICSYAQTKDGSNQSSEKTRTFRMTKKAVKIHIDLGRAVIEGHSGNEIIFSLQDSTKKIDEKAKGLRSINGLGLEDNTGLGINVTEVSGVIQVSQMNSADPSNIKILVPYGMVISFDHQSKFGKAVYFKNIQGEIEVSTNENSIHLENVTGPVSIKTVQGNVEAILPLNVKGPISIVSIYGNVDVALPQTTRSTVKLNAKFGEILVAEEFKLELQKQEPQPRYTNQITGKLNGGGLNIDLRSDNGKIYLRTKK
ncbi:MAG: DUF4097 family beta strand repeat-containing protein [Bacteroidota bacterium]